MGPCWLWLYLPQCDIFQVLINTRVLRTLLNSSGLAPSAQPAAEVAFTRTNPRDSIIGTQGPNDLSPDGPSTHSPSSPNARGPEENGTFRPASPEEATPLLQVPPYQGHNYVDRSYDYMQKYPPDVAGKELDSDARVWKMYLDESESYDNDMVKGFRDTIDALLVFAALFSSVVAGFAIETSQAFEPNYAQINTSLLFEQNQLLRAAGNASKIDAVPKSPLGPDSITHTEQDIWVNFFFFASLTLSLVTTLLSILVKQWLQAFTALIPGDAKERALIRQFRFGGLRKWKLPEIVNFLPLFLHLALALFLIGLSRFVWDFHYSIRYVVTSLAGISFALYFVTIALPAISLECPYRLPIFYIPTCIIVYPFQAIWIFLLRHIFSQRSQPRPSFPSSPLHAHERHVVSQNIHNLESSSLAWVFTQTTNTSVQRIAMHSVSRFLRQHVCQHDGSSSAHASWKGRHFVQRYIPLDQMIFAILRLFSLGSQLEDAPLLLDLVAHASHADHNLLPAPDQMWHAAISSPHLQLLIDRQFLPADAAYSQDYDSQKLQGHPLHHACFAGRWSAVKALIPQVPSSHLTDFDSSNVSPIGRVTLSGSISYTDWVSIFELMKARNVDLTHHRVNEAGDTLLHYICRLRNLPYLRYFLANAENLDCNVPNARLETPLHSLCRDRTSHNPLTFIELLLEHGADVGACMQGNQTPLHDACLWSCPVSVVQTLCASTSGTNNINHRDKHGRTPLHVACRSPWRKDSLQLPELIHTLLSAGADPNITDKDGRIPLHETCDGSFVSSKQTRSPKALQLLLESTQNINTVSRWRETPMDVFMRNQVKSDNYQSALERLQRHGAKQYSALDTDP